MILSYGGYSHQLDEAAVTITKDQRFDDKNQPVAVVERWVIDGKVFGNDPGEVTSKLRALEAAYGTHNQNVTLTTDEHGVSAHKIVAADTASGVKVLNLSYPTGNGAEYTTYRTYNITLEAEYDISGLVNPILNYEQVISITGTGGPRFVVRETRFGRPVRQMVSRSTPITVTQSGTCTAYSAYPYPSSPVYPDYEHLERRQIDRMAPKNAGKSEKREYTISWSYSFTLN